MGFKADAKLRMQRIRIHAIYINAIELKAIYLLKEDIDKNFKIGEIGADIRTMQLCTYHCNAGGLATGGYGTP